MNRTTTLLLSLVLCGACDEDKDEPMPVGNSTGEPGGGMGTTTGMPDDSDDGAPSWAVGEQGEMLRINPDGSGASGYELETSDDLMGIACHGATEAWAVGARGTLIYTHDAGTTWAPAPVNVQATLRAVAISTSHVILAVGDEGSMLVSNTAGATFTTVAAPPLDFTSVATNSDGSVAFVTALDGSLWRYDADDLTMQPAWKVDAALHGVTMSVSGDEIIAVGDQGTWLQSTDSGVTFVPQEIGTQRDLFAVQLSQRDSLALAVGEAGVVVQVDDLGALVHELLDDEVALRALHVSGSGHGITVGDAGLAFMTMDAGDRWDPLGIPTTHDLFGVDEISLHGHL